MTTAIQAMRKLQPAAGVAPRLQISDRVLGLFLASVVPALFWTAMVAIVGNAVGHPPAASTLAIVSVSIATFLALIVGSITLRA